MRFFHLSDLHIGLRLLGRDLGEEQAYVLRQVVEAAASRQPDAVVIAGDIYDKAVPSAEAISYFDSFLTSLREAAPKAHIMVISGNHDSAQRINLYRDVLSPERIHMIGLPPMRPGESIARVTLTDEHGEVHFYLLPFVRPSMVRPLLQEEGSEQEEEGALSYDETVRRLLARENLDAEARNVLVSHQFYLPAGTRPEEVERMDSEIRTVGNIDEVGADVLEPFDYAALGHIHKPMKAGRERFCYPGTPYACSVSEAGQCKGFLQVTLRRKGDLEIEEIPLTPLHAVRVLTGSPDAILQQPTEDFVSVTLTGADVQDGFDLQDRLRAAFPNLLEIRREGLSGNGPDSLWTPEAGKDAFALCREFLPELDEEELGLLRDVFNAVTETKE